MVWLPLLLIDIRKYMIAIIYCPVCDARNFDINHSVLIKPFT